MKIDDNLISYLEDLSYLALSGDEKLRLKNDLSEILSRMACLSELDAENANERSHPFDNMNGFRDDEVKGSLDPELILKNAPERSGEMFSAPKTVG